jgi:hypothetical protein
MNCPTSIDEMRTQQSKWIGVMTGQKGVDLRLDAWIAGTGAFRMRCGGVVLVQV